LAVDAGDDEGGGLYELELQLAAAGVGAAGAEGCVDPLEDYAFLPFPQELAVGGELVFGLDVGADPLQRRVVVRQECEQTGVALQVCLVADVVAFDFEEVEGVERVADGFPVEEIKDGQQ